MQLESVMVSHVRAPNFCSGSVYSCIIRNMRVYVCYNIKWSNNITVQAYSEISQKPGQGANGRKHTPFTIVSVQLFNLFLYSFFSGMQRKGIRWKLAEVENDKYSLTLKPMGVPLQHAAKLCVESYQEFSTWMSILYKTCCLHSHQ